MILMENKTTKGKKKKDIVQEYNSLVAQWVSAGECEAIKTVQM